MKILALLSRVPWPLEKGDKLRAYHQLRQLSQRHEIMVFAISHGSPHPEAYAELQRFCTRVVIVQVGLITTLFNTAKAWLRGLPAQGGYFFSHRAQLQLTSLLEAEKPDHVYCQLVRMGEFARSLNIPKTIDYQDVFSQGVKRRLDKSVWWLKPFLEIEYQRMVKYESKMFDCFDAHTIIAETDRQFIQHPRKGDIHIVENGVDTGFFSEISGVTKDIDLVFTGNMSYPPNILAAEYIVNQIVPACHQMGFTPRVLLAGAAPAPRVKALASARVTVTGWMDDIRLAYARSHLFVAPMQIGTGLQNKLLEAMAMGLPSITSELANGSLKAISGTHVLIGESAMDYARHIHTLLSNAQVAETLAHNGQTYVRTHFNWEASTRKLEQILLNATEVHTRK